MAGLRRGFVFRWGWLFMGRWFVGSVGSDGGWTGLCVVVGDVDVWGVCGVLFRYWGKLAESGSWWLLLCGFGVGVGSWVELGAEGVQSGLVAVGQGWVIGFGGGAFGMIVGE